MSRPLRSKQGCWTCRLRKKKCDEGNPYCSTCESLSITCYGFGHKPDWMDNGEKERAVLDSFKNTVKHTSRRKTSSEPSKRPDRNVKIAPNFTEISEDIATSGSSSRPQSGVSLAQDHVLLHEREASLSKVEAVVSSSISQ